MPRQTETKPKRNRNETVSVLHSRGIVAVGPCIIALHPSITRSGRKQDRPLIGRLINQPLLRCSDNPASGQGIRGDGVREISRVYAASGRSTIVSSGEVRICNLKVRIVGRSWGSIVFREEVPRTVFASESGIAVVGGLGLYLVLTLRHSLFLFQRRQINTMWCSRQSFLEYLKYIHSRCRYFINHNTYLDQKTIPKAQLATRRTLIIIS